jgi:glycosyltransferase involved in cell wall biosynthesis
MSTNDFPLVSVIIPFYNHNHFIKKTLDSILEDTYPNKEIIILNDGSSNPDDSNITNWIEQYKDTIEIRYIKRDNKGLTKTFNELIKMAYGEYILPCASDDYFINNTITKRVEILQENESKNTLILLSDNIVVDDSGQLLYGSNLFEYRQVDIQKLVSAEGLKYSIISNVRFTIAFANCKLGVLSGRE